MNAKTAKAIRKEANYKVREENAADRKYQPWVTPNGNVIETTKENNIYTRRALYRELKKEYKLNKNT